MPKRPALRLDKVLLIVNSDVALSETIADYYVTARGLNPAHRLTFAAGTGNKWTGTGADFYSNVVTTVADYINAHDIRAVICSAGVPVYAPKYDDDPAQDLLTANTLGHAGGCQLLGKTPEGGGNAQHWAHGYASAGTGCLIQPTKLNECRLARWEINHAAGGLEEYHPEVTPWRVLRNRWVVPFGRLGLPNVSGAPAETESETKRMIDDAIACEQYRGVPDKTVLIGRHDRVRPDITALQGEQVRRAMAARGIDVQHMTNTIDAVWDDTFLPDTVDYTDFMAGSLNLDIWGLLGSAIMNEAVGAAWVNSCTFARGAWCYESTSAGFNTVINVITNGGCAGFGALYEPWSSGVPRIELVGKLLLQGKSMAEACAMGWVKAGWAVDCFGDPLYRPFGKGLPY